MQIQDGEVSLVEPAEALREPYLAFYEEWKASGEPFVPWVTEMDPADFGGMIQTLHGYARGTDIPDGWVSSSTFWLVTTDKRVVGAVNIRHRLTERLLHSGGHIGYGIVPSARRQGYASEL